MLHFGKVTHRSSFVIKARSLEVPTSPLSRRLAELELVQAFRLEPRACFCWPQLVGTLISKAHPNGHRFRLLKMRQPSSRGHRAT
jgi:hypothetical protein